MRFLFFTDLQADESGQRCFTDPSLPLQRYRVNTLLERLKEIYDEHECEGLIDGGDTTDNRTAIPLPTLDSLLTPLAAFQGENYKIIGNHEQWLKNGSVHAGKIFSSIFHVIPGVRTVRTGGIGIIFASYPADYSTMMGKIAKAITKLRRERLPILLIGHFTISGVVTNSGTLEGVPLEMFEHVDLGLLGHIHKPQSLNERIHYVGSPFQQNFGEEGEKKRVAIIDTDPLKVTWVPIKGFPRYQTVTLDGFKEKVREDSENRFKVTLFNAEQTEEFYAHPLSHRAEAVYNYDNAAPEEGTPDIGQDWGAESAVKLYTERVDFEARGIPLSREEMISFGMTLIRGEEV